MTTLCDLDYDAPPLGNLEHVCALVLQVNDLKGLVIAVWCSEDRRIGTIIIAPKQSVSQGACTVCVSDVRDYS
jgi:hypothetical protein